MKRGSKKYNTGTKKPETFEEWCKMNPDNLKSETLGTKDPDYYLKNRLFWAWTDGVASVEQKP